MQSEQLPDGEVAIRLSKAEALVLFDWLHRTEDEDADSVSLGLVDQAERRILWDLGSSLESILAEPLLPEYDRIIDAARASVRDPSE